MKRSRARDLGTTGTLLGILVLLLAGCAYLNSLYNAQREFGSAEEDRWAGRTTIAQGKYQRAIDKAARSFRSDPEGRWADDALVLMGRAYLHRSEWEKARGALRHVLEISDDEEMRGQARLYLGAVQIASGNPTQGIALLDSALVAVTDPRILAEGHLWRAKGNLRAGRTEAAWRDLDAAGESSERHRMAAEAERLVWAVETDDTTQAYRAADRLLSSVEGRGWGDSVAAVADRARRILGPGPAARLLQGADDAPWPPAERNRLLLDRARLAAQAGDTAAALQDVRRVSRGVGRIADEARVLEARWRLPTVSGVQELEEIRELLLPAVGSRDAVAILGWIRNIGLMVEDASTRSQSLAFFAAAELARDSLNAPLLARDLFRVYADRAQDDPWAGKALLAALQLDPGPRERERLRLRLDSIPDNIYVRAWAGNEEGEMDYVVVERRLRDALGNLKARIGARAEERDILVSQTARMLDSIRTEEDLQRRLEEGDSALVDSLRADSIQRDSIRRDSIRRADSLAGDTAFFPDDSIWPDTADTTRSSQATRAPGPAPRPILIPYRRGPVPPPGPDPLLGGGGR